MKPDEILALARKCGFYAATDNFCGCSSEALQSFAAAIAEHCAQIIDKMPVQIYRDEGIGPRGMSCKPTTFHDCMDAIRQAFPAPEQGDAPPVPASADRMRLIERLQKHAAEQRDQNCPIVSELPDDLCEEAAAALSATPEQGRVEERNPDYVYDKSDWEWTSTWVDRDTLTDGLDVGGIIHVGTLSNGPDKWACRINETEVRWFDTKEEAEAAIAPRATTDHDGEATP